MTQSNKILILRRQLAARRAARRSAQRGMTLLEILAVVTIIAFVMGGSAFIIMPLLEGAAEKTARSSAKHIQQAVQIWQMTNGSSACPELDQLIADKVLQKGSDLDPWKEKFRLTCQGGDVIVQSAGPSKKFGTEDDVIEPEGAVVSGN